MITINNSFTNKGILNTNLIVSFIIFIIYELIHNLHEFLHILLQVINMLINYTSKELDLCARLMRAEALAEGDLGMLMVGNVIVNRAIANCIDFKNIRSITDAIYQKGAFVGTKSSLFNSTSTTKEKELARRVLRGEYYYPATNALWFYAPSRNDNCRNTWFGQRNTGRYKNHCFYAPDPGVCKELY